MVTILKSRDTTLPTKVRLVKAMVFPVVMYECESWTIKKAKCQRIDAIELWCWRRLLRVPWTARRSNQSILKEISPAYSLKDWCWSWNSNTLGPPDAKGWFIRKDPDAGKDWRRKERGITEDEIVILPARHHSKRFTCINDLIRVINSDPMRVLLLFQTYRWG